MIFSLNAVNSFHSIEGRGLTSYVIDTLWDPDLHGGRGSIPESLNLCIDPRVHTRICIFIVYTLQLNYTLLLFAARSLTALVQ